MLIRVVNLLDNSVNIRGGVFMAKKDDKKVKNSGSILMGRLMGSIFKDIDKATNEHEVQAIYMEGGYIG